MVQFVGAKRSATEKKETVANASHILVASEQQARALLVKLKQGADERRMAKMFSQCPSSKKGGSLGEFRRGQMVPAFDKAIFAAPLRQWCGPVKTQFGYHLYKVLYRR